MTHLASFELTDALVAKFILSLPPLETVHVAFAPDVARHLAVTHCIAHFCALQLHYPFFDDDLTSAAKCMAACKNIMAAVAALPPGGWAHADPVLSVRNYSCESEAN